jgi:hypothetical protein
MLSKTDCPAKVNTKDTLQLQKTPLAVDWYYSHAEKNDQDRAFPENGLPTIKDAGHENVRNKQGQAAQVQNDTAPT